MKDADSGCRVRSQGFFYSFCFRFVFWKLYSLAINRVDYFYSSNSFLKEVRMNKGLCLKYLYQNARCSKYPRSAQIWLTHSQFAGWGPRAPILSTLSLTVRNFKKAQATPLAALRYYTWIWQTKLPWVSKARGPNSFCLASRNKKRWGTTFHTFQS